MKNNKKEDYIFSKYLETGKTSNRPEQITRRWKRHVKDKLGIEADFYSLKHLNTDETAALLDLGDAAAHESGWKILQVVNIVCCSEFCIENRNGSGLCWGATHQG